MKHFKQIFVIILVFLLVLLSLFTYRSYPLFKAYKSLIADEGMTFELRLHVKDATDEPTSALLLFADEEILIKGEYADSMVHGTCYVPKDDNNATPLLEFYTDSNREVTINLTQVLAYMIDYIGDATHIPLSYLWDSISQNSDVFIKDSQFIKVTGLSIMPSEPDFSFITAKELLSAPLFQQDINSEYFQMETQGMHGYTFHNAHHDTITIGIGNCTKEESCFYCSTLIDGVPVEAVVTITPDETIDKLTIPESNLEGIDLDYLKKVYQFVMKYV